MATVSTRYVAPNIQKASTVDVYAKRNWNDSYTYLPFVHCESAKQSTPPTVGNCILKTHYGMIKHWEDSAYEFYQPYLINNSYVTLVDHDTGTALETYVMQEESVQQNRTYNPSGSQVFTGFQMYHLFDRLYMGGSYTVNGFVDQSFIFNENLRDTKNIRPGNMSISSEGGVHVFNHIQNGRTKWSNLNILKYILKYYVNGSGSAPIQFDLVGDTASLANIYDTYDLNGRTVFEAINTVIDRKRGVAWKLEVNYATNTPVLKVFLDGNVSVPSTLGFTSNTTVRSFWNINLESESILNNEIKWSETNSYDTIQVMAGNIYSTGTFSYDNGLLRQSWNEDDEYDYLHPNVLNASDAEAIRSDEYYKYVYAGHGLPLDWNGYNGVYNMFPRYTDLGYLDLTYYNNPYINNAVFESQLSIQDSNYEYRKPFCAAFIKNYNIIGDTSSQYQYFDLSNLDAKQFPSVSLENSNENLSFLLKCSPTYLLGKNHVQIPNPDDTGSPVDPTINPILFDKPELALQGVDYLDIFTTQTIKTNARLKTILRANNYRDIRKTKVIELSDALNCHYVLPGTVSEISNGQPVTISGGLLKNDIEIVKRVAYLCRSYYAVQRASINYTVVHPMSHARIGDYIVNHIGRMGINQINSTITDIERRWDKAGCETTIITGFNELEWTLLENDYKGGMGGNSIEGTKRAVKPRVGTASTGKSEIKRYSIFPVIPAKPEIIYGQGSRSKWSGGGSGSGASWVPLDKFVNGTLFTGVPGTNA